MTATKFWTPGGVISTREETRFPPEFMVMIAAFADAAGIVDWGLHCSRCKQDIVGKNAKADNRWLMECGCRTYIGANPLRAA